MENSKYNSDKREWLVSAVIGIRKQVLIGLREMMDGLDREIYTAAERSAISQEITEIAEMVSEKDSIMKKLVQLKEEKKVASNETCLVDETRIEIIKMLKDIRQNLLTLKYEGEYAIADKELRDIENMVREKDRLVNSKVSAKYSSNKAEKRKNVYLNRFFAMDGGPNI